MFGCVENLPGNFPGRLLIIVSCWLPAFPAQAQLFGNRTVGSPMNSLSEIRTTNSELYNQINIGSFDGSERFLRGNRSRRDFVGSDRFETTGFVGSEQAIGIGRVRTTAEDLRLETSNEQRINRPLPPQPASGLYYPKLVIAFDTPSPLASRSESAPSAEIQRRVERVAGPGVQVMLSGKTALIRGNVESEHAAELLLQILNFEPGIDSIQHRLTIGSQQP